MKPKLYIHVREAKHFLRWELPEFARHFQLVHAPDVDAALLSFGPEVLDEAAGLPALKRFAYLFPGFGRNPLHNLDLRRQELQVLNEAFEAAFVNPGPLQCAYAEFPRLILCPFSVDVDSIPFQAPRNTLSSLLHVSADYPQKDWQRSEAIMRATGLPFLVFPPRGVDVHTPSEKVKRRLNRTLRKLSLPEPFQVPPKGYVAHSRVIELYRQYDGFVHVAAEINHPSALDGAMLATMFEAGLTGAILFWHDTFGVGSILDTAFDLPLAPEEAAKRILELRDSLEVAKHSKATREEIAAKHNPAIAVAARAESIIEHLTK